MATTQEVRAPRVDSQGPLPAGPGLKSKRAGDRPQTNVAAASEGISVTAPCGPLHPAEGDSLMQALLLSSQGTAWEPIHRSLVSSQASTEALRTPFTMTVDFNEPLSGALRASWDLGLDQASVAILGELPPDVAGRRRLFAQMEELLAS